MESLEGCTGIGTNRSLPATCFDEPLWRGMPVCTVDCPGNHRSHCPDYQAASSLFDRSARLPLNNACIDYIKLQVGDRWLRLAKKLGFSAAETAQLAKKYLGKNRAKHLASKKKVPGFVFLLEDLVRTALTAKGITAEEMLAALEGSDGIYAKVGVFRRINNQTLPPVELSFRQSGRFESYIFLIWIKKDMQSPALPNTVGCPIRQRCYDWANHNPDKLVVLWYRSSMLDVSSDDHEQLLQFQKRSFSEGITNLLLLDIDEIQWQGEKRFMYPFNEWQEPICDLLKINDKNRFKDVIDRLRPILLSRGSTYIKSAMKIPCFPPEDIPERGAYFDVDYLPVPYKTFCDPDKDKPLCRDCTFDSFEFEQGALRIISLIINSFLAVSEEGHEAIMNYPVGWASDGVKGYALHRPHQVASTKMFRMSDCHYADDGTKIRWHREATWDDEYVDRSASCPLSPAVPPVPEYLAKFRKTPDGMVDPMIKL